MPFPRASSALSRFTVLDLTRIRSGPTAVRQLSDWGANVIKIDALTDDSGGEQPGGPRQGSDFQNLHRNKRAMTLNLKDPQGLAVFKRLAAKADVVVEDERETGRRALLNLGHTFGHALEAATEYDSSRLVHGEGVAIGMVLAHQFSARMNLASPDDAVRVEAHLKTVGLPTRMSDIPGGLPPAEMLMKAIGQDKKVKSGKLTFILTHGVGQSFVAGDVPPSEVLSFLKEKHPQ